MRNRLFQKLAIKPLILAIFIFSSGLALSQTLSGKIEQHAGQQITLTGFNYYKTLELGKTVVDSLGNFSFIYSKDYKGMGVLQAQDNSSLVLLLTEPNIVLNGTHLTEIDSLGYAQNSKNNQYLQFANAKSKRDAAYMALKYLQPLYKNQKELQSQKKFAKAITNEIKRIEQADTDFLKSLDKESYLRWFIPMKQLVQDMPATYNRYTERIPENIKQFREIDFKQPNFKNSGLLREVVEGHYMLLENMVQSLDSIYTQMNLSTKHLINNLQTNEVLLNEVCSELFRYFEKRSLFAASEYLSVSLLKNQQCSLNDDLVSKLESYRKLKVGAIAPDIILGNNTKLSNIKSNKLVVFGASWCPNCKTETLEFLKFYDAWKAKNVEIIYISIDTDQTAFETAYNRAPWQTYCDYKGWETQAAKDYYVSGTPTSFLLDADNKILVRPNSVSHANVWIERNL